MGFEHAIQPDGTWHATWYNTRDANGGYHFSGADDTAEASTILEMLLVDTTLVEPILAEMILVKTIIKTISSMLGTTLGRILGMLVLLGGELLVTIYYSRRYWPIPL